ncbi:MAG: hypothetical protein WA814_12490 [Candidatus Baltobacteraceae bacterium]
MRRYGFFKAIIGATIAFTLLALAAVQLASDSLDARAAAPGTFPARIPPAFGLRVYRLLDRIAPAAYVEATLARQALDRDDADAAERYALRLPASPTRDELLAQVALSRGQETLALEYFLAAPDADAIQRAAEALAVADPAAGYALERQLRTRLALLKTHPDAVAEASWRMGLLANREAWRQVSGSGVQNAWLRRAMDAFEAAVALAPLSERYVISAANQADLVGERARAQALFTQGVQIDPASADALAGLGVEALHRGDRTSARAYLARSRALDPNALMVRALERALR